MPRAAQITRTEANDGSLITKQQVRGKYQSVADVKILVVSSWFHVIKEPLAGLEGGSKLFARPDSEASGPERKQALCRGSGSGHVQGPQELDWGYDSRTIESEPRSSVGNYFGPYFAVFVP